jgi:hypothetical protein
MAANNLTFNFTTPSDGLSLNATGAFSDHILHIHQSTGNPGAGTQGLHIGMEDPDPIGMTIDMMAASTSPAFKVLSGTTDLTGGLVTANNATSTLFSATTAWLTNLITGAGSVDLSASTVKQHLYPAFSYATSTAFTGTTTIYLAPSYQAETWNGVKCETDVGTLNVSFYDGTNRMNMLNASTTIGTFALTTNNSFTAGESRRVDIGTPATSPTRISCSVDKTIN